MSDLANFSGAARLFPLPGLVLFPHVVQPLHVFEPRYRQLTADALADDRLLALALLQPGWEADYEQRPPIHEVVCLSRIHQEERLADGRYNLLVHGLSRARVLEEVAADKLYRLARVELLPDAAEPPAEEATALREQMGECVRAWLEAQSLALDQLGKLLAGGLSLGVLCDLFGFALPLEVERKQQLLAEADVGRRCRLLVQHLQSQPPPAPPPEPPPRRFPPDFSAN
jgi:Lon protease-like protein